MYMYSTCMHVYSTCVSMIHECLFFYVLFTLYMCTCTYLHLSCSLTLSSSLLFSFSFPSLSFSFPFFSFSLSLPLLSPSLFFQITPQFYSSLTAPQLQQSILHSVLDLMIASTSSSLTVAAKQSLQQVILQIKSKNLCTTF